MFLACVTTLGGLVCIIIYEAHAYMIQDCLSSTCLACRLPACVTKLEGRPSNIMHEEHIHMSTCEFRALFAYIAMCIGM